MTDLKRAIACVKASVAQTASNSYISIERDMLKTLISALDGGAVSQDALCTDCDGAGITKQTERYCSCAAGIALRTQQPQQDESRDLRLIKWMWGQGTGKNLSDEHARNYLRVFLAAEKEKRE